jgi:hypothetical protein
MSCSGGLVYGRIWWWAEGERFFGTGILFGVFTGGFITLLLAAPRASMVISESLINREELVMANAYRLFTSKLSEDMRYLRAEGLTNESGTLNPDGRQALAQFLYHKFGGEFVAALKAADAIHDPESLAVK